MCIRDRRSKTSNVANLKGALLPLIAVAFGLEQRSWFNTWLTLRERAGLNCSVDSFTMPRPFRSGTFTGKPITATQSSCWLRELLCYP
eukprot:3896422-Amphidinium_carterae.1